MPVLSRFGGRFFVKFQLFAAVRRLAVARGVAESG